MQIEAIHSYSAHADYKEIMTYLACQDKSKVKKLFLVHGEPSVQENFKVRLNEVGFTNIDIPGPGNTFELV